MTMIFVSLASCGQDKIKPESELKKMNVSGNVTSIKETKYASISELEDVRGTTELSRFNKQGNKESVQPINSDGSVTNKTLFTYNDNNNLVKQVSLDSDNKPFDVIEYVYDEKGRLLQSNHQNDEDFYMKYEYKYDENNNLILEITYNEDNTVDSKNTYAYNENNELTEEKWLYADGAVFVTIKSEYADSGKKMKESRYRGKANLFLSIDYNEKGNQSVIYEYDPKDQSEIKITKAKSVLEYEYDEIGNWTSKKTLTDDVPSFIIIREFEYQK